MEEEEGEEKEEEEGAEEGDGERGGGGGGGRGERWRQSPSLPGKRNVFLSITAFLFQSHHDLHSK